MIKVLTGGTFNKLHPGHEYLLKECKKLGYLVVVVANDAHNDKPNAVKSEIRKKNLEKLGIADKIVVGHPDSFVKTVYEEKPNVIALGYDQKMPADVTEDVLKKLKTSVIRIEKFRDY
jgi:FAD synthetase